MWIRLTGTLQHLQGKHLHKLLTLSQLDQLQDGWKEKGAATDLGHDILFRRDPSSWGKGSGAAWGVWCSSQHCKYQQGWCSSSSCPFCQPALLAAAGIACWLPQLPAPKDSQHSTHRHWAWKQSCQTHTSQDSAGWLQKPHSSDDCSPLSSKASHQEKKPAVKWAPEQPSLACQSQPRWSQPAAQALFTAPLSPLSSSSCLERAHAH